LFCLLDVAFCDAAYGAIKAEVVCEFAVCGYDFPLFCFTTVSGPSVDGGVFCDGVHAIGFSVVMNHLRCPFFGRSGTTLQFYSKVGLVEDKRYFIACPPTDGPRAKYHQPITTNKNGSPAATDK